MTEYIDLGEDSILFNNSFELRYILHNSSYFCNVLVTDKKKQMNYSLQVFFFFTLNLKIMIGFF